MTKTLRPQEFSFEERTTPTVLGDGAFLIRPSTLKPRQGSVSTSFKFDTEGQCDEEESNVPKVEKPPRSNQRLKNAS